MALYSVVRHAPGIMAMRFLILTQYYPPEVGAAQLRLAAMARELVRLGHEVEVVTGMPNYPEGRTQSGYRGRLGATEHHDGVTIRRTWLVAASGRGFSRLANYGSFAATSLAGLAASKRPDVVFVESPPPSLALPGWLMARRWGAKLVLNVSDLWPDSAVQLGLSTNGPLICAARRLESWAYARADLVTAVTEGLRKTLVDVKHVPAERILFLPNGIDADLFAPRARDEALAAQLGVEDRQVVLIAGTLGYALGIDVALEAAALLADRPISFLIAGDGSDRERLEGIVRQQGLTNVRFLGSLPVEQVAGLYSIANIGLLTLRDSPLFEGTRPARVLAAMASAVPVIYSGRGEGARLVQQADAGLVMPPEDPQALADAINQLIDDPQTASRMGTNGRRCVEDELTWPRLVESWVDQLQARVA
jgi:colanic acid biosynthesis glycosyl transferase WcaI